MRQISTPLLELEHCVLIQPILDSQAVYLGEVGRVASQDCGVVRESDACDFQIQGADTQALAAVPEEYFCRVSVPRENDPVREGLDLALEFGVRSNLAVKVVVPAYFREPAAHLLLDGDNRKGHVGRRGLKLGLEARSRRRTAFPLGEVVCIKNQQSPSRRFAALDTRVRAARPLESQDRP